MNQLILYFITLCHFLTICFVVLVPFLNNAYLLTLHAICVPFIILHWILNNNTCILTIIETKIKEQMYGKVDENECFTCRLINPIYDVTQNYAEFSDIIYIISITLWIITVVKLYCKFSNGEIKSLYDLFKF